MIRSFKGKHVKTVIAGKAAKGFPQDLLASAERKLQYLAAAAKLDDLRVPPGNRLEARKIDRDGQHSIRINDQWRICFYWRNSGADDVEIVDYH